MTDQPDKRASITRTYRAAVRLGEDFITLEETITLPIDADEQHIQQAVEQGWRIYQAQHASIQGQIAEIREALQVTPSPPGIREPDAPASDKQRNFIGTLQHNLNWSNEQLTSFASEHGFNLLELTKGQASEFIDVLKRAAGERSPSGRNDMAPISDQQQRALRRMAGERGISLEDEVQQRFGLELQSLNNRQAGELIQEWQGQRSKRRAPEEAEPADEQSSE
jgi:hypothetical protein